MPTRAAASSSSSRTSRKAAPRAASPSRKRASNADHAGHAGSGGHRTGHASTSKAADAKSTARGDSDTAPAARRAIWKGAISFGLLHVPVALYPASRDQGVDFDWLDKRTMDPVGYKRINKRTGKDIDKSQIVKGVKQDNGDYVLVSDDEIRKAYPTTTQTIEIETFVPATQVSAPVQGLASSQPGMPGPASGSWKHPSAGSHPSVGHGFPSDPHCGTLPGVTRQAPL